MSSVLDVDIDGVMKSTDFYKTRSVSEDGKSVTFHNDKIAFLCKPIPAISASRLFGRYPLEIVSWCYLGLAIRKNAVLSAIKTLVDKEVHVGKEPAWEDDDVVDKVWKVINEHKATALFVASYDEIDNPHAYSPINSATSCYRVNDQDIGLLEIMTVSTAILRLTYDNFFLSYKTFLEKGRDLSIEQGNMLGINIPNTLLDLWTMAQEMLSTQVQKEKDLLKKRQEEALKNASKKPKSTSTS